jgi:acetyl-CoA C-acetyltransferase
MNPSDIFIVAAKRTPFGRFLGRLAELSPVQLALAAGEAALQGIDRSAIDLCILGNVLGAGHGMNIARQVGLGLGLPLETPAFTVNQMCASGMTSVLAGIQAIRSGEAGAVLCGGTESMSLAPHLLRGSRTGKKLGDSKLVDSVLQDGLIDPSSGEHMGLITAERLAASCGIGRAEQDAFAVRSHQAWAKAEARGDFARERITMEGLSTDEQARPDSSEEKLALLAPAFLPQGTVTAANASGLNDGAAVLLLASEVACRSFGWTPMARVAGWATVGCDPAATGLGPVYAVAKLQSRFSLAPGDFDAVEINEAFAVQALACSRELHLDEARFNPCGGAIAIGHPIGASGARLATHLANRIAAGQIKSGLGSLCVGGGMGIALALEAPR